MSKGLSIADFYTEYAGLHDEINTANIDEHSNPVGREFDLGLEGAFKSFQIIIMNFHDSVNPIDETVKALEKKGFTVTVTQNLDDFLTKLPEHDEAWFISSKGSSAYSITTPANTKKFVDALQSFRDSGKGIFVWADNKPFFHEANLYLKELLNMALIGDTRGKNILKPQAANASNELPKAGKFSRHLITTGIVSLYEGNTICYPEKIDPRMTILGQSTDGHPCFFCIDEPLKGRVVVDCGFTKLYKHNWDKTAGTERFVRNCAVWLLSLDSRFKSGKPLQGDIRKLPENTSNTTETTSETN